MTATPSALSIDSRARRRDRWEVALASTCAIILLVRLVHLYYAMYSPLSHQLGADEDYYFRFGQAVAAGRGALTAEFAFMDPAYGYFLGALFWLVGPKVVSVFMLQILADTFTGVCVFLIGRELGRPRAGLIAALLYAVTATAVMFSTSLLKDPWAGGYMAAWVLFALKLLKRPTWHSWLLFGLWCGVGVALRANLLLMSVLGAVLLVGLDAVRSGRLPRIAGLRLALFGVGLALPLSLLALRNHEVSGSFSPMPNNAGIVLHQLYNPDNPSALTWIPPFVSYAHPSEIWRGYANEAERRTGHALTPREVDRYWRAEAVSYILAHPGGVARNIGRKLLEFGAYLEVPNNRNFIEERLYSPVLRALPAPAGWLFALGVPGVLLLLARDPRGLLVAAPILATVFTFSVFFAQDRFRFHCIPLLALGAGLFLDALYAWAVSGEHRKWLLGAGSAMLLGTVSVAVSARMPQPEINWSRTLWGYVKMGELARAKAVAARLPPREHSNTRIQEALGYIAAAEGRDEEAAGHYRRAIELAPDNHIAHFNLAKLLSRNGDRPGALRAAEAAVRLSPLSEYRQLLAELSRAP